MNVNDYLALNQSVELEILEGNKSVRKIPAVIEDIGDSSVVVKSSDMLKGDDEVRNGSMAEISGKQGGLSFRIPARVAECGNFPLIELVPVGKAVVTERRHFVRIEDHLPCIYTILTHNDYEESKSEYLNKTANEHGIQPSLSKIWYHEQKGIDNDGEMNTGIVQLLVNIDRKLDMILNSFDPLASQMRRGKDATIENVSGSGVSILSKEELAIGEIVSLEVVLPTFPISPMTIFGQVMRVTKPSLDDDEGRFGAVITFTTITEDDRDSLVRYIFQKQREVLRAAREAQY